MSNRALLMLLVVIVLAIGAYVVFEGTDNEIEVDLPELDIDN